MNKMENAKAGGYDKTFVKFRNICYGNSEWKCTVVNNEVDNHSEFYSRLILPLNNLVEEGTFVFSASSDHLEIHFLAKDRGEMKENLQEIMNRLLEINRGNVNWNQEQGIDKAPLNPYLSSTSGRDLSEREKRELESYAKRIMFTLNEQLRQDKYGRIEV
jgi:hypothetical protein